MDSNPFQSPHAPRPEDDVGPGFDPRKVGQARQVPIVAALMMANGVMVGLIGIGWMVFTTFFTGRVMEQFELQQQIAGQPPQMVSAMRWFLYVFYGGMGLVALACGAFNIIAGGRNYHYRGRIMGIIAMIAGLASVFFCYCLPFSAGVLIYGLVIYLGQDAERAFRWQQRKDQSAEL
jgi:hypothetical protein